MALTDINSVIASLATPGGVTLIAQSQAPNIKGRRGLPTSTSTMLTDVVHHPNTRGDANTLVEGAIRPVERLTLYFRQQVLPAVTDPNGTDPWLVLVGSRWFKVESVEPWAAGGFWVAQVVRINDSRAVGKVSFRALTNAQVAGAVTAAARGALVLAGSVALSPTRSFRFALPAPLDVVGITWPAASLQPSDTVAFRAINPSGNSVVVVATSVEAFTDVDGVPSFVAILPEVLDAAGALRYEVL